MNVKNLNELLDAVLLRKISFLIAFFVIFLISYGFLSWLDFLPEPVSDREVEKMEIANQLAVEESIDFVGGNDIAVSSAIEEVSVPVVESEPLLPETLIIDRFNRTINVLNPSSNNVADLDAALLNGAVRHPDSATLDREGSVFILAHSSYLPTVLNKNFQAFNGIQNLKFGDTVRLQAKGFEYVYRVDKVYKVQAQDATVAIAGDKKRLILATCNSFGSKDDRYIVEAELVEVKSV
jgi:LPXTG-site transpeptidase (sortase) family protein